MISFVRIIIYRSRQYAKIETFYRNFLPVYIFPLLKLVTYSRSWKKSSYDLIVQYFCHEVIETEKRWEKNTNIFKHIYIYTYYVFKNNFFLTAISPMTTVDSIEWAPPFEKFSQYTLIVGMAFILERKYTTATWLVFCSCSGRTTCQEKFWIS